MLIIVGIHVVKDRECNHTNSCNQQEQSACFQLRDFNFGNDMMRKHDATLVLNVLNVIGEHLFVCVAPESEDHLEQRCPGHYF